MVSQRRGGMNLLRPAARFSCSCCRQRTGTNRQNLPSLAFSSYQRRPSSLSQKWLDLRAKKTLRGALSFAKSIKRRVERKGGSPSAQHRSTYAHLSLSSCPRSIALLLLQLSRNPLRKTIFANADQWLPLSSLFPSSPRLSARPWPTPKATTSE